MKLLYFYSHENFSNTYILGPDHPGDAIVIDPGVFHAPILEALESRSWEIRSILITRQAAAHLRGLKTLLKIYSAEIYAHSHNIFDFPCHEVKPGHFLQIGETEIGIIGFPELSHDAVMFQIRHMLFSGDVLSAGDIGDDGIVYKRELIIEALHKKLFPHYQDLTIYPGEGPPTSLKAEKLFNPWLNPESRSQPQ